MRIDNTIYTATGTNSYTVVNAVPLTEFPTNQIIFVKFQNANTLGTLSLTIDGLALASIWNGYSTNFKPGDIQSNAILALVYENGAYRAINHNTNTFLSTDATNLLSTGTDDGVQLAASNMLSADAGNALVVSGVDNKLYFNEVIHTQQSFANLSANSGDPIVIGTFQFTYPGLIYDTVQIFVDGVLQTIVGGNYHVAPPDYIWDVNITGQDVVVYFSYRVI